MHGEPTTESHELAMGHGMDMDAPEEAPPCHDDPMLTEPPPVDSPPVEKGADCEAPCCTAAPEPTPLTVSPSVPDLPVVGSVHADLMWTVEPVHVSTGEPERPRSSRWYLDIQRVRL